MEVFTRWKVLGVVHTEVHRNCWRQPRAYTDENVCRRVNAVLLLWDYTYSKLVT